MVIFTPSKDLFCSTKNFVIIRTTQDGNFDNLFLGLLGYVIK